jgi:hypothetical protein
MKVIATEPRKIRFRLDTSFVLNQRLVATTDTIIGTLSATAKLRPIRL